VAATGARHFEGESGAAQVARHLNAMHRTGDLLGLIAPVNAQSSIIDVSLPPCSPRWKSATRGFLCSGGRQHRSAAPAITHRTRKPEQRIDAKLTVRFETSPGEQAQCDLAEVGRYPQPDGR